MKSDIQVRQDILEEFKWEPQLNGAMIEVAVTHGVVTLSGQVDSYAEKWHAGRVAHRISGVKALSIEIGISQFGSSRRNDDGIVLAAIAILDWMDNIPRNSITVKVDSGWVTLSGEVEWEHQKQTAAAEILELVGVTGISDEMSVKPKLPLSVVVSNLDTELEWRISAAKCRTTYPVQSS